MAFLGNLVKVFPGLASRPLHITGESYAGMYIVSACAHQSGRRPLVTDSRSTAVYLEGILPNGKPARQDREHCNWRRYPHRCCYMGSSSNGRLAFNLVSNSAEQFLGAAEFHRNLPAANRLRPRSVSILQGAVRRLNSPYMTAH